MHGRRAVAGMTYRANFSLHFSYRLCSYPGTGDFYCDPENL